MTNRAFYVIGSPREEEEGGKKGIEGKEPLEGGEKDWPKMVAGGGG